MASAKRGRLPLLTSAIAVSALLGATNAFPMETEPRFHSYGLGQESCGRYLSDIASDQLVEQLYSAWLAGFMTIAGEQMPDAGIIPQDSEMSAANAWIKNYCGRRASDTYLTATVRLLAARERNQ
jgi:hypothetical protein